MIDSMNMHLTMGETVKKELFTADACAPVTKPSQFLMIVCLIRRTAESPVSYNGGGFKLTFSIYHSLSSLLLCSI